MCSKSSSTISIPNLPDLSYLSDDERKIIEAVLERQKLDEEKNSVLFSKKSSISQLDLCDSINSINTLNSNSNSNVNSLSKTKTDKYHSINDIAQEIKQRYGDTNIDTGQICDLCKKTKFTTQSSGHTCYYCKLKCCLRCGVKYKTKTKQLWICNQCKLKQNAIFKSDQWLNNKIQKQKQNSESSSEPQQQIALIQNKSPNLLPIQQPSNHISNVKQKSDQQKQLPQLPLPQQQQSYLKERNRLLHTDSVSSDQSSEYTNTKTNSQNNNLISAMQLSDQSHQQQQQQQQTISKRQLPQINVNKDEQPKKLNLNKQILSLKQTQQQQPAPPKQQHSLSSSDDDFDLDEEFDEEDDEEEEEEEELQPSTTEYTTGDEMDIESCSLSERGVHMRNIDDYLDQNLGKEEILAAKMKKFLSPITWKLSSDTKSVIGTLIIKRNMQQKDAPFSIGFKIVGGKRKPDGTLGAFIDKIKKGSLCETLYNLKCGDEIIEWNSIKLKNLTYDQVFDVMSKSKNDSQLELVIERKLVNPQQFQKTENSINKSSINSNDKPDQSLLQHRNSSLPPTSSSNTKSSLFGRLELKIYHDTSVDQLNITLLNINCIQNQLNSVYCELYLLPNRNKNDIQRTSNIIRSDNPSKAYTFNDQLFIYENVNINDINSNLFMKIVLFDAYKNKRILGQCTIKLRDTNLKNEIQSQLLIYNSASEDLGSNETISTQFSFAKQIKTLPQSVTKTLPHSFTLNNNTSEDIQQDSNSNFYSLVQKRPSLVKQLTNESSNENLSINNNKRRQLPQIPLDKQQVHRNKVAHELEEKARKIKIETDDTTSMPITNKQIQKPIPIVQPQQNKNHLPHNSIENQFQPIKPESPVQAASVANKPADMDLNKSPNISRPNFSRVNESPKIQSQNVVMQTQSQYKQPKPVQPYDDRFTESPPLVLSRIQPAISQTIPQRNDINKSMESLLSNTTHTNKSRSQSNGPSYATPHRIIPPERIRDLKQRTQQQQPPQPQYQQPIVKSLQNSSNIDYDSEGSEISNASKISSTSIMSTQSERPSKVTQRRYNTMGYNMGYIDEKPAKYQSCDSELNLQESMLNPKQQQPQLQSQAQKHQSKSQQIQQNQTTSQQQRQQIERQQSQTKLQQQPKRSTEQIQPLIANGTTTATVAPNIANTPIDVNAILAESLKTDGTLSDSALSSGAHDNKKRRASMAKALVILGLSKKSNSACNLTLGKRFGFARSEEIGVTPELRNLSVDKTDSANQNSNENANVKKPNLWSGALKLPHEQPYNEFVDSLGPGQKVGRQVLGSPCLGEIQMSIVVEKGQLVVEIIRARNLKLKSGYRVLPAAYVKLYLFDGRCCIEKMKTSVARRTLEPMYQEVLRFQQNYRDKILQVTVWGDYGKLDRKVFMGVAQIVLNDLNLTSMVIGWYKLYSVTSLMADYTSFIQTPSSASATNLASTDSAYSIDSQTTVKTVK